ncbi:cyclin-dependent kinase inhibitor far1 [Apophysomyces sp. BC1034]|nr:cyclin-dependent kinase inhibitor far1 [Apophysomyces sp. BC1034]
MEHETTDHDSANYKNKTVLITGATGIVGKAVLWKLIQAYGDELDKVYVLVRPGGHNRSSGGVNYRLEAELLSTTAFKTLAKVQGQKAVEKLIAIPCDLSAPDLGLSAEDRARVRDSHIIIHCAGSPEYGSTLDWSLEINVLATLRMMDLADECPDLCSFVHMSSTHHLSLDKSQTILEQVYSLGVGDPEDVLKELVTMDEQERVAVTKRIMQRHPTIHLFTKALAEHLILRRVEFNKDEERHGGKKQWAVAIMRSSRIGPSAYEPYPGWTSGLTGINAWIALHGRGVPILQPDQGQCLVDVVPVDYIARAVIGCIPRLKSPGTEIMLPYADMLNSTVPRPSSHGNSFVSASGAEVKLLDIPQPNTISFPYIFHISSTTTQTAAWHQAYAAMQEYWLRTTHTQLLPAEDYFTSNKALSKARFFIRYYLQSSDKATPADEPRVDTKWMELASKIRSCNELLLQYDMVYDHKNLETLAKDWEDNPQITLALFKDIDWEGYFMQSCYGVHAHSMAHITGLRTLRLGNGWDCALYTKMYRSVLDQQIESVVYTVDDVRKRILTMVELMALCLRNPERFMEQPGRKNVWVECLNDTLEDWCTQNAMHALLKDSRVVGQWKDRMDDNNEVTKVIVLNDHRVGQSVKQLAGRSGIVKEKVVEEALKILVRMLERTQLSYVWFTGSFLKTLLQSMFSGIRIQKHVLENIREQVQGKRVVYVPFSKTLMDPLIVWYLAIRYQLPVPAIVVDEALAMLGPFSDLLRLAGTAFVKRDPSKRSELATSVTAAYMQVLLREHAALLLLLEPARSRTGIFQKTYNDGLLEMTTEAILEKNQSMSPIDTTAKNTSSLKDLVFIPIQITYEHVPDLPLLVDQDLNHRPVATSRKNKHISRAPSLSRPSEAKAARGHRPSRDAPFRSNSNGRLLVGVGDVISLESFVDSREEEDTFTLSQDLAQTIRQNQKNALILSPISLVAAILLHTCSEGGTIGLDKMCEQLEWFRLDIHARQLYLDWEELENSATIVFYCIDLLNKGHKNVVTETKGSHTMFRMVNRAESILQLSYHASQVRDVFLLDSLFSVVYLSFETSTVARAELLGRFRFLARLFEHHAVSSWDIELEFEKLLQKYKELEVLISDEKEELTRHSVRGSEKYTRLTVLASFVYPAIDVVWVTVCALSVLSEVKGLPSSLIPTLSQWIGAHLISGRRTMYNEVLSTEYNRWALESLMKIGLLTKRAVKDELSPDAQMLLQTLGLSTNDDLIQLEKPEPSTKDDPVAEICRQVETVRIKMNDNDNQVYEKSLWQMRNLIKANPSFSRKQGAQVLKEEDGMIQLAWSLLQTMSGIES